MKKTVMFAAIVAGSLALSACGKKEEAPAADSATSVDAMGGASAAPEATGSEDASAASTKM